MTYSLKLREWQYMACFSTAICHNGIRFEYFKLDLQIIILLIEIKDWENRRTPDRTLVIKN